MKITLICGSVAKKSHTQALLQYIENLLLAQKIEAVLWDFKAKPLVFAIPELHRNPIETPDNNVKEFIKLIENSTGLVIGSPLYHGSYSGVLKNALDNLYLDALRNKAVGLVSHGAGSRASILACEHLRGVIRTLHGYTLQTQMSTGLEDYAESSDGFELTNSDIKNRCVKFVDELVNFAKVLKVNQINKK